MCFFQFDHENVRDYLLLNSFKAENFLNETKPF